MAGFGANYSFTDFLVNDGVSQPLTPVGTVVDGGNGAAYRYCLNDSGASGVIGRIPAQKAGAKVGNVTFLAANALISPATTGVTLAVPGGVSMCAPPVNSFFWCQVQGPNAVAIPTSGAIGAGETPVITGAGVPTFIAGPSLAANWGSPAAIGITAAASAASVLAVGVVNISVP